MNKKKKKQNGFTIVELVIVIAVIGILAAILIPTFSNLVKKAKQSADQQLVYHINEAVVANEVDNLAKGKNGTEATMYDTLQALENDYGFTIEKMTPRSGNDIIWDSTTNRFALVAKDGTIVYDDPNKPSDMTNKAKMWRITEAGETLGDGYSHYLTAGWSGEVPTVSTGLDVGDNDDITAVTYDSSSDASAVVRTNGGTLTVVAPNGTVKHYGEADKVDVQAVANASYHENGVVKLIAVKKGHVELEGKAEVNGIYVYNESTSEQKDTSFEDIKITVNKGVDVPKFSRSAVEVQPEGTKVCTVVTDQAKDIYLFNEGIYEQIKTVDAGKNVASDASATWADNSAKNTENTQTAAMQLANEFNGSYDAETGKIADQEVTVGETDYTVKFNEETRTFETYQGETKVTDTTVVEAVAEVADVSSEAGKTEEEAEKASALKGTGTQADPFLIYDYETMQKITEFYDLGYYNFKVDLSKTDNGKIDCSNWVPVKLNGNFDGSNVLFNNLDTALFARINGEASVVKNFTINANITEAGGVGAVTYKSATLNLTIDSVDVHGTIISDSWVTPYVEFGPGATATWNLTIKNCVSDATLVATSGVASGFVGHPYNKVSQGDLTDASLITIIDSAYVGNMSATKTYNKGVCTAATPENNFNFKYFTINGNNNRVKTYYSSSFIQKLGYNPEGTLYNTLVDATGYAVINNEDGSKTFFCGNYGKNVADYYRPSDTTGKKAILDNTAQATLPANVGDVFTINKVSGAVKAVISLQIAPNDSNNYGSYLGTYMSEEIDISAVATSSTFTSENVRYFTINVNSGVTNETGINGNIFNIVNSYYGKNAHNGATVKIVQFDANGNVLNITSVTIAAPHNAE